MKEIFDRYLDFSFDGKKPSLPKQDLLKMRLFELNYKQYFPSDKNAFLLDVGIGKGEMLSCMRAWGFQNYLGIDISDSTVQFCRSQGLPCERAESTEKWILEKKDKFFLITLLDVLEHLKKEEGLSLLKALKAALQKEGLLIIQVPNFQAPDNAILRYGDITHEVGYTEHSLQQMLLAAGFEKFDFFGLETLFLHQGIRRDHVFAVARSLYWINTRFTRCITGNPNPKILNPIFYGVVYA
jgi:2-polyprenyl-3-methyl-5-hydroxy-6-metoxy-1,4-benzoquinol methylase